MKLASDDQSSSTKDRAKASGMAKALQSWSFVIEIAFIRDVLDVLHNLSLYLQRRDASVIDAKSHVDTAMRMLAGLKSVDGLSMMEVNTELGQNNSCFHGLNITHTENERECFTQMRMQFIEALLENVSSRFPSQQMMDMGACLNPTSFPENEDDRIFFGDKEVAHLAEVCHVDKSEAVAEFRIYKNNPRSVGHTLASLLKRARILPISSAECERGFSCMNSNDTPERNRLSVSTLSALIFLKVNGPTPDAFNPLPYVNNWIKDGRHGSLDPITRKSKKIHNNPPMASVFQ